MMKATRAKWKRLANNKQTKSDPYERFACKSCTPEMLKPPW